MAAVARLLAVRGGRWPTPSGRGLGWGGPGHPAGSQGAPAAGGRGGRGGTARTYAGGRGSSKGYQAPAKLAGKGGALRQFVRSPGLLADPYRGEDPPQPWADLVAVAGWRERGRRWLKSLQSVYTLAKCTRDCKPSFSLPAFKTEAGGLYEDVSRLIAEGDRTRLRHLVSSTAQPRRGAEWGLTQKQPTAAKVTDKMYGMLKQELRHREKGGWARVEWDLAQRPDHQAIELVQGRLMQGDSSNDAIAFAQLTCKIRSVQTFAAYDRAGKLVAGDARDAVDVTDHWVFERLLNDAGGKWLLAARLAIPPERTRP